MCVQMTLDPLISPCSVSDKTTDTLVHPENQPHPYHSSTLRLVPKTITVPEAKLQWNLIITVTLGPNLAGCYIEVAVLLSGIKNHHN